MRCGNCAHDPISRSESALLRQSLVAGMGNVFKSEVCFASRVNPFRLIGSLTADELQLLMTNARKFMLQQRLGDVGRPDRDLHRNAPYHRARQSVRASVGLQTRWGTLPAMRDGYRVAKTGRWRRGSRSGALHVKYHKRLPLKMRISVNLRKDSRSFR